MATIYPGQPGYGEGLTPASATAAGSSAASIGSSTQAELDEQRQRAAGMFDNATVESRFMAELEADKAARDATAKAAQDAADEAAAVAAAVPRARIGSSGDTDSMGDDREAILDVPREEFMRRAMTYGYRMSAADADKLYQLTHLAGSPNPWGVKLQDGTSYDDVLNKYDPNRGYDGIGSFFRGIPRAAGGMATALARNPAVMGALTAGLSTPATAGGAALMTPVQAAVTTGAVSGAASSDNPFTGALRGGAIGGLTAGAGQYAGGLFDNPMLAGAARGGAGALTGALLSGSRDPYMAAGQGALFGGLSGVGQPSRSLSDENFDELMASVQGDIDAMETQPNAPARPFSTTSTGLEQYMPAVQGAYTPIPPEGGVTYTPADPTVRATYEQAGLLTLPQTLAGAISDEDSEAAPTEPISEPEKAATTGDYVKYAKKVFDLFQKMGFGVEVPEYQLPPQTEEMSDEEYQKLLGDSLVEYLGLRPEDFEGLTPGTQEFLDYVLSRADALIANIFGSDPSALLEGESVEGLQAALRDLSEDEAQELMRAMYVRGALGRVSSQTEAVDPFTGETVEIGAHEGEADLAAAQVGFARTLADIARDPDAANRLRGLLGRNVDIYGLTAAAESRNEAARRAAQEEEDRLDDEEMYDEQGNRLSKAERRRRRLARQQLA